MTLQKQIEEGNTLDLPAWVWPVTIAGMACVVVLDLTRAIRNPHRLTLKESASWAGVYITSALLFGMVILSTQGAAYGSQFYAGYLTELALSIDNLFVFLLIIQAFRVPEALQSGVLLVGIFLSIILRGGFIALGVVLIEHFSWVFLIFGVILIWTAIGLLRGNGEQETYEPNRFMKLAQRRMRTTPDYHGGRLLTSIDGKRFVTPLMLAMLAIGSTDILFALDSIPAIFGLTQEAYLVWTATVFALFGLRQLYFLLAALLLHLRFLAAGLSVILGWIGVKLIINGLAENHLPFVNGGEPVAVPHIPTSLSLGFIAAVLLTVLLANWILLRRQGRTWAELFVEATPTPTPATAAAGKRLSDPARIP